MRYIILLLPFFVFFTSKVELHDSEGDQLYTTSSQSEKNISKPFELFPNPVISKFTLKSSYFSDSELEIYVFDVSGKLIIKLENVRFDEDDSLMVDISHLNTGLYFIQLRSGNYSATKKIYKT